MAKSGEDTPLLRQYFSIKAQYPEAILLYRVGDFYETYSDDAVTASKVLGLVLTKRSNGDKGSTEMAGFPHHAIEGYLQKLVRAGYKVAICDQLEDPNLTKTKLVKRGVTEILTPGIAFGEGLLDQKEHNFLAGLTFEGQQCGAAFLDVSTGTFQVAQGSTDYIGTLLSSFRPTELVVRRDLLRAVKEKFSGYYVTGLDEWAFVRDAAEEKLKDQFGTSSLKGFAIDRFPLAICSAGALIVYLEQTHHSRMGNICSISRIDENRFVWMDKFTLRNLEVFPLGTLLGNTGDLERIISRAATGKILPREVRQLGRSLEQMSPIHELCSGTGTAALDRLAGAMRGTDGICGKISSTLCGDSASMIGKGDVIAPGIDSELDELRAISRGGKEYLSQMQRRETERTGISSLKIGYNNVFGYYIEVRNTFRDKVPPEWIRKQTLVSAERYITEELKEYEEKILGAESRIYEIESRIFGELVKDIQASIRDIQQNCRVVSRLDVLRGFAVQAAERGYCRPVVDKSSSIEIRGGRHPVIETMMPAGEEYVPNDITLDSRDTQIMVLTGPNMAGKSALLRQVALIVLMAQTGSFVPAQSARFGYFDKIFTRVGATDNISRGESTFMVEMLETAMIMHNLSARSLVLLDEIGRGTSTYDGMSIASALVQYIHDRGKGAKTLFATHYHELNDLEKRFPRVKNYHISVKEEGKQVIFLRKLVPGGVAHSFGIHVARMAGMPKEIIDTAERTLRELELREKHASGMTLEEDGSVQLSLFQLDDPTLSSIRRKLEAADLNNMTPMQAFDLLREMKQEVGA